MARNRHKGNSLGERFIAIPHSVMTAPHFVTLSSHAVKLLLDVAAQYKGDNNGDLSIAWKLMRPRGWHSETTLHKSKRALLAGGFLYETRAGRRPNVCSLFALTWHALDPCDKFDPGAKAGFTRGEYRFKASPPGVTGSPTKKTPTPPRGVAACV
jgi:hypothetical protein